MFDVISFLNSFVNRPADANMLARAMAIVTESARCALFVKGRDSNMSMTQDPRRESIDSLCATEEQQNISSQDTSIDHVLIARYPAAGPNVTFHSSGTVTRLYISNNGSKATSFRAKEEVHNLIIIPIMSNTEHLGALCLYNSSSDYDESTVRRLSPYISITQLILAKKQLMLDYKRVCDDKSYASKDLFLANMSHEIRTPLNGVIGYGQLLIGTELSQTQRGYLNSMNQCSIQLMQIINDVLDFSKLTSGKMRIHAECFPLKDVIDGLTGAIGQRLTEKRQKLSFEVSSKVPEFIVMDKHKLIQVLVNLVSNASKFTDIGGNIKVSVQLASPRMLSVSVEDDGIGISDADQCKLFNTFMQIESSTYKSGTGLGLAIAKKICELLGGDITARSVIGEGSCFTFTTAFDPIEVLQQSIRVDAGLLKGKMVLVVDDNADNRIVVSEMLESWEMEPVAVSTALEALRLVMGGRYAFDLALIDICMPGTTGTELAKQIKEERPFFPLVALSSIDSFVNTAEFESKLDKPINKVQLFNSIHNILVKTQQPSSYIGNTSSHTKSTSSSPAESVNKQAKILVAEDIEHNRNLIINMLQNLGYTNVDQAVDGQDAFDMIAEAHSTNSSYEVIILDIRMPKMDGHDVMHAVKLKGWNLPKVVVVTASVLDEDRDRCASLGAEYFLSKPVDLAELRNVMLRVTKNSS